MFRCLFSRFIRVTTFALLIFFISLQTALPNSSKATQNNYDILIISSYHIGYGGTDPMITGIKNAFSKSGLDVNFHIEYLDTKRFSPDLITPSIEQLYQIKFNKTTFDVILVADNNAFNFIRQFRDKIFPDTPVVFCGINNYKASMIENLSMITGVAEDVSLKATIDLALSLHPDTTHLAVLSDSTTTGAANFKKFNLIKPGLPNDLEIVDLSNLSAKELAVQLNKLSEKTILLQLSFYKDRDGRQFTQKEQMDFILEISDIPIYSAWDFFIAHGVVGGIVTYFPLQGEIAGRMAVEIIKGTPIQDISVVENSPNIPLFDFKALKKHNIPLSALPEKSIVLNIPQTFYTQNKALAWTIVLFVILQSLIIGALIIAIRHKRQTEALLLESETKYRQLYQQAPVMLHETDIKGCLIEVNDHWLDTLGYKREDVLGKHSFDFFTNESQEKAQTLLLKLKRQNTFKDVPFGLVGQNGDIIDALSTIYVEKNPEGQALGTRAAIRDITDSNKVKAEKEALEKQLRMSQKLESIGQLAGGVAHDLNNLLSPILGYSDLLLHDSTLDETHKSKIQQIGKAGKGAKELIRQLLAFSRKQTLEFSSININDVIKNYEDLLKRTIREDIEIKVNLSSDLPPIHADLGQIEQVIMNITVNAADSMPEGGKLIIETSTTVLDSSHLASKPGITPGEYVMISCSDTGSGMDEDTCKQIFEPFFSTKGELGTGLGLATVYGIIKQHKGNIWVYSELNKGTTFRIYLPVVEEIIISKNTITQSNPDPKGNETILLVEDNDQVMSIVNDILQHLGYNVLKATNGNDAIAITTEQNIPIQLLLTDVIMPDMNGRDLFAALSRKQPRLKVIYMSGYTDDVIAHHGVLENGVNFIQKPFTTSTISNKIRKVFNA